jgi:hypothetical protein
MGYTKKISKIQQKFSCGHLYKHLAGIESNWAHAGFGERTKSNPGPSASLSIPAPQHLPLHHCSLVTLTKTMPCRGMTWTSPCHHSLLSPQLSHTMSLSLTWPCWPCQTWSLWRRARNRPPHSCHATWSPTRGHPGLPACALHPIASHCATSFLSLPRNY